MDPQQNNQQLTIPLDPATLQILKNLIAQFSPTTPAGIIAGFGSNTPPSGWLVCDGSAVSRTTYAALFAAIATNFGAGDGSTTFNLPDGRGQVMAGKKAADPNFGVFGNVAAGEVTHVLTAAENGPHAHNVAVTFFDHASFASGPAFDGDASAGSHSPSFPSTTSGSGTPHNNIQPTFVANFIIKT